MTKFQIVTPNYTARRQQVERTDSSPHPIQSEMIDCHEYLLQGFQVSTYTRTSNNWLRSALAVSTNTQVLPPAMITVQSPPVYDYTFCGTH